MDYTEEQASELEALESIYPTEFALLSSNPAVCKIDVQSSTFDEETGQGYCCCLKFRLPLKYPEEVPDVEIIDDDEEDRSNLEEDDIKELKDLLLEQATENTGMAMIFTLVSAAQEWLSTRWDTRVKRAEEEAEKRLAEAEEAERHRFDGTRVTVQTFIEWKIKFEAEMKQKDDVDKEKESTIGKKLTGKELFLRDKTLNESDLQFLEEGYDSVPIDESLFDDVDDLEIVDDDEED